MSSMRSNSIPHMQIYRSICKYTDLCIKIIVRLACLPWSSLLPGPLACNRSLSVCLQLSRFFDSRLRFFPSLIPSKGQRESNRRSILSNIGIAMSRYGLRRAAEVLLNQSAVYFPSGARHFTRRKISGLLEGSSPQSVKQWRASIGAESQIVEQWTALRHRQAARTLATVRRQAGNRVVDIGARARQLQKRRLWTYALSFSAIAGFVIIVLSNFEEYLVFYITPTDALERFNKDPSKNKFRLGGLVLEGSVLQEASSVETEFVVTDLITDILVRYQGALPDLFREGHSVVVEGFVRPLFSENCASPARTVTEKAKANACYFSATEVLAKHDEKYMPKEVAEAIEKNRAAIEAAHPEHPGLTASQQRSKEVF